MAKLVSRITAAEARVKANDLNTMLIHVYEQIKETAEDNRFYTWFYFWGMKKEMIAEVIKDLLKNGYNIELFETEEDVIEDDSRSNPKGEEALKVILGIKEEKETEEEKEDIDDTVEWKEIRISWN